MVITSSDIVPGQWIVLMKPYFTADGKVKHLHSVRHRTEDDSPFSCETRVEFDMPECRGYSAEFDLQTKEEIEQMDGVLSIEPVRYFKHCDLVDTPCWGLERISRPQKVTGDGPYQYNYRREAAGQDTLAYILDTGIKKDHDEFEDRVTQTRTIVTPPESAGDEDLVGHGTHVAGTVGGKTYGVARKANIVAVKVFFDTPDPKDSRAKNVDIIKALEWVQSDARGKKAVVNMSFGGSVSPALNAAVAAVVRSGVVCCVAAGNEREVADNSSPASEHFALTVGSMDKNDRISRFSNYVVDVFGPGSDILSAWKGANDATRKLQGTSMASPHVAGLACCMLSDETLTERDPFAIISQITIKADKNRLEGLDHSTSNSVIQV